MAAITSSSSQSQPQAENKNEDMGKDGYMDKEEDMDKEDLDDARYDIGTGSEPGVPESVRLKSENERQQRKSTAPQTDNRIIGGESQRFAINSRLPRTRSTGLY